MLPSLVCPKSKKPLRRAFGEVLLEVNALIRKKRLIDVEGKPVTGPLSALWIAQGAEYFYPERNKIPVIVHGGEISNKKGLIA